MAGPPSTWSEGPVQGIDMMPSGLEQGWRLGEGERVGSAAVGCPSPTPNPT